MHLSVTKKPGGYILSIEDLTGGSFSVSKSCGACRNTLAEVTAGSQPGSRPANFGTVHFGKILVVDNNGIGGGLKSVHWNTARLVQTKVIHTVSGPLHTLAHPLPHSEFADQWVG